MSTIPEEMKWPADRAPRRRLRLRLPRVSLTLPAPASWTDEAIVLAGAAALVSGVWMVYRPAAVMLAGALLLLVGVGRMR